MKTIKYILVASILLLQLNEYCFASKKGGSTAKQPAKGTPKTLEQIKIEKYKEQIDQALQTNKKPEDLIQEYTTAMNTKKTSQETKIAYQKKIELLKEIKEQKSTQAESLDLATTLAPEQQTKTTETSAKKPETSIEFDVPPTPTRAKKAADKKSELSQLERDNAAIDGALRRTTTGSLQEQLNAVKSEFQQKVFEITNEKEVAAYRRKLEIIDQRLKDVSKTRSAQETSTKPDIAFNREEKSFLEDIQKFITQLDSSTLTNKGKLEALEKTLEAKPSDIQGQSNLKQKDALTKAVRQELETKIKEMKKELEEEKEYIASTIETIIKWNKTSSKIEVLAAKIFQIQKADKYSEHLATIKSLEKKLDTAIEDRIQSRTSLHDKLQELIILEQTIYKTDFDGTKGRAEINHVLQPKIKQLQKEIQVQGEKSISDAFANIYNSVGFTRNHKLIDTVPTLLQTIRTAFNNLFVSKKTIEGMEQLPESTQKFLNDLSREYSKDRAMQAPATSPAARTALEKFKASVMQAYKQAIISSNRALKTMFNNKAYDSARTSEVFGSAWVDAH